MTAVNRNNQSESSAMIDSNGADIEVDKDVSNFTGGVFETEKLIGIKGNRSTISFNRNTGALVSFSDAYSGLDFISVKNRSQLFDFILETPKPANKIIYVEPQVVQLENDSFNLSAIADIVRDKDSAIFINEFEAEHEELSRIGVASDWWVELYVNGENVYTAGAMQGNGSSDFSTDCHIVEFPVKKGHNIIIAKVINGTTGWRFVCGKPNKTCPRNGVSEAADLLSHDWQLYLHAQLPEDLRCAPEKIMQISGPELQFINAGEFNTITAAIKDDKKIDLNFSDHTSRPVAVTVSVREDEVGLMRLSISINNSTDGIVKNINFLRLLISKGIAKGKDLNDKLIAPSFSGSILIDEPWKKTKSISGLYPYLMELQFIAYYNDVAGLYMATYDGDGHYKKMSIILEEGEDIQMNIEHYQPELPGNDVTLSYETILGTFNGDWYTAADIYKKWAITQQWCAKTINERDDLPKYLTEGAAILAVPFLHEMPQYKLYSYDYIEKFPQIAEEYRQRTNMPHIGFVPMGWENKGAWAGINYFPALPSNEIWRSVNKKLCSQGDFTFMLPSGYKWVIKRQATELMGPEINDTADFEAKKAMTIHTQEGKPWIHDGYDDTSYYGGITAKLCHSSSDAKDVMRKIYKDIAELGVSIIQFDQEHGGAQDIPCYNPTHGHKPGYTNEFCWDFSGLCQSICNDGKAINPNFGLSIEGCGEQCIQNMATMWGRQCSEVDESMSGVQSIAMFSYIYHEFLPIIGDGFSVGQGMKATLGSAELRCFRLAKALVRGLIPTVYMEQVPINPENEWQRKVSTAFTSYCRTYKHFAKYLIKGVTLRPPKIECATQNVWHYISNSFGDEILPDGRKASKVTIERPTVIAGSFKAYDKTIGIVIANTTEQKQKITVHDLPENILATIFNVDNEIEAKLENFIDGINLDLEAFGVRVIVLKAK